MELENELELRRRHHPGLRLGSPEWSEATADPQPAQTDFVGIAIHCARARRRLRRELERPLRPAAGRARRLHGVQRAVRGEVRRPGDRERRRLRGRHEGQAITDPRGSSGFPGFDGMFATNTLGYVAAMQESGIPVTSATSRTRTISTCRFCRATRTRARRPGRRAAHQQQLKDYDTAFENFFDNLGQTGSRARTRCS